MAAGDFSASQMPLVLLKQNRIFLGGARVNSQRNDSRLQTVKAVLENQTARPIPVMTGRECTGVKITWLKACDEAVVDCADEGFTAVCDITGPEIESVAETLPNNLCLSKSFTVTDDECNDLFTYEDKMAEAMLNAKYQIEKELSERILAAMYAELFPASSYPGEEPPGWDLSGDPYLYPGEAALRPLTLSQMYVITQVNNIVNPIVIGDGTWQADQIVAQSGNNNGGMVYNEASLFNQWGKWYFDPVSLMAVGDGVGKLLMFDPNNVILWSKNDVEHTDVRPFGDGDKYSWKEPSLYLKYKNGTPIYYDAWMQLACVIGVNNRRRLAAKVQLIFTGGFAVGPATCVTGDTGILYFEQVTPTT